MWCIIKNVLCCCGPSNMFFTLELSTRTLNAKQRQSFNSKQHNQCVLPTLIICQRYRWRGAEPAAMAVGFLTTIFHIYRRLLWTAEAKHGNNQAGCASCRLAMDGRAGGREVSVRVVTYSRRPPVSVAAAASARCCHR